MRYIVDGPWHNYDEKRVTDFIAWLEASDIACLPSGRYYALQTTVHYWTGHFYFGFADLHNAAKFANEWDLHYIQPGCMKDGKIYAGIAQW